MLGGGRAAELGQVEEGGQARGVATAVPGKAVGQRPEKRAAVRTSQSQREPAVEGVERGPGELDAGGVQSGPDLREHGREVGALREVEGDLGGNVRGCALFPRPTVR